VGEKKKEGEASSVRWWQARKTSKSGKRAAKGNSGKHSKCTPWSTLIVLRDAMPWQLPTSAGHANIRRRIRHLQLWPK